MHVLPLLLLISLVFFGSCSAQGSVDTNVQLTKESETLDTLPVHQRLQEKLISVKTFLAKNQSYDQKTVIMIDMRIPSNNYRFFVVNLDSSQIIKKGLVSHGSGSETGFEDSLRFSNTPNSYCTSLGKYRIGAAYIGSFGRSYRLHGLDPSNNKAFARAVVLHRYQCVPNEEQNFPICNSLGCPMLSEQFFEEVDQVIRSTEKPILMEIYY
jgi:hypothetical protein